MRNYGSNAHPWMANSLPDIKRAMLDAIGAKSIEDLFEQVPLHHRLQRPLNLPPALRSEVELKRHLGDLLKKNVTCAEHVNFLGAGCWQHHVPAVVDEIVGRAEFLTPVWGSPQSDHGRNQAWFEYASQLGELVGFDVVSLPVYSWGCAAGHALRMASRITGRHEVLVPANIDPERLSVIRNYCEPIEMANHIKIVSIARDRVTGLVDVLDLRRKLTSRTAAVYIESPNYLGLIEAQADEIGALAHAVGAQFIVGADPISLGILKPPAEYAADIAVGPTQPLGVHMNCGGGVGGYMASRDEEKYVREYNGFLISITETERPGQYGFGLASSHQTSYGMREHGKDWTGNSVYLWAIANAVYLALLGPAGLSEVGELITANAHAAATKLSRIRGVEIPFKNGFFKEFVVNFDATGKTVAKINQALLTHRIFGGKDLSGESDLGESALYCVTEVHTDEDIDHLVTALEEVLS
jgi:glycine dehydrogenase subunit 1